MVYQTKPFQKLQDEVSTQQGIKHCHNSPGQESYIEKETDQTPLYR